MIATVSRPALRSRAVENRFRADVLRTLLYYDIWRYPLSPGELHTFLQVPAGDVAGFTAMLDRLVRQGCVGEDRGYYFIPGPPEGRVSARLRGERRARRMWLAARLAAHAIKRFPFVRGVFVSGDLSKNISRRGSDVDFLILTEPGRLWIARTLLVLFKRVALFGSKKFFCVNSFAATDSMEIGERNIYQAAEIAQLKPLFNTRLFERYIEANGWIMEYFPNFRSSALRFPPASERRSVLQWIAELPFSLLPARRIDDRIMRAMERYWTHRYPQFDGETRSTIFRCAPGESRAYAGNYQGKVLSAYGEKLREFGVTG